MNKNNIKTRQTLKYMVKFRPNGQISEFKTRRFLENLFYSMYTITKNIQILSTKSSNMKHW